MNASIAVQILSAEVGASPGLSGDVRRGMTDIAGVAPYGLLAMSVSGGWR